MGAAAIQMELNNKADYLGRCVLFVNLKDVSRERIAAMCEWRSYAGGDTIFAAGQYEGGETLFIGDGEAELFSASGAGGRMRQRVMQAGEWFGAAKSLAAEKGDASDITLTAKTDVIVASLYADAFRSVLSRHPAAAMALVEHLATRLAALSGDREAPDPDARVFAELIQMAERDRAAPAGWRIVDMPRHRQLADCAGVSETGAAEAVARLIREGVARRNYPGLDILDYEKLKILSS